jgi:polyisoprenoid-binding protein YceI
MKLIKIFIVTLLASGVLFAGNYNFDIAHSSVSFKVKHMMISTVDGQFKKFNGSFSYDEKTKTLTALSGKIDASSVNTKVEKRDADLRSSNFFDVVKYPMITFKLTKVVGDKAYGKLSMHGITKKVVLDLQINGTIKDPWGNTRTGMSLNGKINREDFGLKYNMVMEAGGILIGKNIKINIELEGILVK